MQVFFKIKIFVLYALYELATSWFFVFNHSKYSRWLSVHIKDLEEIPALAPMAHKELVAGNFVVRMLRKTKRPFSALAVDQADDQKNAIIKSQGGAVGLTQDTSSLRRFTIAGPEVSRLLKEFEHHNNSENDTRHHHEQYTAYQKKKYKQKFILQGKLSSIRQPVRGAWGGPYSKDNN